MDIRMSNWNFFRNFRAFRMSEPKHLRVSISSHLSWGPMRSSTVRILFIWSIRIFQFCYVNSLWPESYSGVLLISICWQNSSISIAAIKIAIWKSFRIFSNQNSCDSSRNGVNSIDKPIDVPKEANMLFCYKTACKSECSQCFASCLVDKQTVKQFDFSPFTGHNLCQICAKFIAK